MKIDLEDKGTNYILVLEALIESAGGLGGESDVREEDKRKIALFLKYADPKSGAIRNREGIIKCVVPTAEKLLVVLKPDSGVSYVVLNGLIWDEEIVKEHFPRSILRQVETTRQCLSTLRCSPNCFGSGMSRGTSALGGFVLSTCDVAC